MINFCLCIWFRVHLIHIQRLHGHCDPSQPHTRIQASLVPLVVASVPALAELLNVLPFALLFLLLLFVPESFAVLIQRAHGAAQHAQVVLIALARFGHGRIF